MAERPSRGEVWQVTLDPTRGHEQGWTRPCLVLSVDRFNHGPAGLVTVVPITRRDKGIPSHIRVPAGTGGLKEDSSIKCEEVRTISKDRLFMRWGQVDNRIMEDVSHKVRMILGL